MTEYQILKITAHFFVEGIQKNRAQTGVSSKIYYHQK